jgi:hypothetical protein
MNICNVCLFIILSTCMLNPRIRIFFIFFICVYIRNVSLYSRLYNANKSTIKSPKKQRWMKIGFRAMNFMSQYLIRLKAKSLQTKPSIHEIDHICNKPQSFMKGPRVKLNLAFEEISKIKNSIVKLERPIESCFGNF